MRDWRATTWHNLLHRPLSSLEVMARGARFHSDELVAGTAASSRAAACMGLSSHRSGGGSVQEVAGSGGGGRVPLGLDVRHGVAEGALNG